MYHIAKLYTTVWLFPTGELIGAEYLRHQTPLVWPEDGDELMTAAEQVPLDADSADPHTSQENDDPELEPVTCLEVQPGWALPPNTVIRGQNSAAGPHTAAESVPTAGPNPTE